jgi:hypothetical protein
MADSVQTLLVTAAVLAALVYVVLRWSGVLAKLRRRHAPDVPVASLTRKRKP